ncbi:MAG: sugar phosphate isomerase/epimerase [Gammaproteobacteria bacterium]|nr:sugar phosphate isomerase/epimerase [Gammaproteobacteria bacterium]
MDRRTCIKLALLAAGGLLSNSNLAQSSTSSRRGGGIRENLGFQLFTVRHLLADDFRGTIEAIAAIGYREFEMVGFGGSIFLDDPLYGYSAREFRYLLDDLGVRVPTAQFSGRAENLGRIAATAKEIGIEYLILGMPPEFLSITPDGVTVTGVTGLDQVKRIVDRLNGFGETFRQHGMGFAFHNHHMEFACVGEETAYDFIMRHTDPDLVKMELDAGWAAVAGVEASDYLVRYPGRFIATHMKDYDPGRPRSEASDRAPIPEMTQLVTPGDGAVDFGAIMAEMDRTGVRHAYVEVDLPDDALATARRAYHYLRNLEYSV